MDYRAELSMRREQLQQLAANGVNMEDEASYAAYLGLAEEAMYACVLVAEENCREQDRQWENSSLAREILTYALLLKEDSARADGVNAALQRMADLLYDHPRLRLCVMEQQLKHCSHHSLAEEQALAEELAEWADLVARADAGEWPTKGRSSFLKCDPVEWSPRWEEVIDQADRIVFERLEGVPRGMGFCFAYWHERKRVLHEMFGLEWRTPSEMNPRVMFD